jgi:CubicO group peptidase (beta-lactamase class C family)
VIAICAADHKLYTFGQAIENNGRRSLEPVSRCITRLTAIAMALCNAAFATPTASAESRAPISATGVEVPELAAVDRLMLQIMHARGIPGGAAAVAKDGRLVFARGYGLADKDSRAPVQPDSLFRVASLSKPITTAAVLKLVEAGRLRLDDQVLPLLANIGPLPGKQVDRRWQQITIRQLLHHTAGFDAAHFEPMFASRRIAKELRVPSPPDSRAIIRFMLARPLDFDPGARYCYSNFGYCLLGRIIENVSGKRYDDAVRELVLTPAGIRRMRLGRTPLSEQSPDEVHYYAARDIVGESVFAGVKQKVAAPYGLYAIEAMDAHGGWVASAVDLLRFVTALDGSRKAPLVTPATIRLLESPPAPPLPTDPHRYYGLGWDIVVLPHGANWLHCGRLAGSASMMVRLESGVAWALLFNADSDDSIYSELDRGMHRALDTNVRWPAADQFPAFR